MFYKNASLMQYAIFFTETSTTSQKILGASMRRECSIALSQSVFWLQQEQAFGGHSFEVRVLPVGACLTLLLLNYLVCICSQSSELGALEDRQVRWWAHSMSSPNPRSLKIGSPIFVIRTVETCAFFQLLIYKT